MALSERDRQVLSKIVFHCDRVIPYVNSTMGLQEFLSSTLMQDAAVHNIIQIGELAYSQLSEEGKALLPGVPWNSVIRMRHKLVHHYESYSAEFVYDTATKDIPAMRLEIQKALSVSRMNLLSDSE